MDESKVCRLNIVCHLLPCPLATVSYTRPCISGMQHHQRRDSLSLKCSSSTESRSWIAFAVACPLSSFLVSLSRTEGGSFLLLFEAFGCRACDMTCK